jgi:hypothetical protein
MKVKISFPLSYSLYSSTGEIAYRSRFSYCVKIITSTSTLVVFLVVVY